MDILVDNINNIKGAIVQHLMTVTSSLFEHDRLAIKFDVRYMLGDHAVTIRPKLCVVGYFETKGTIYK